MLATAAAFFRRDFLQAISYRASFILQLVAIPFWAALMYYVSGTFRGTTPAFLAPFGGSYFPFLLIGVALVDYHTLSLQIFSNSIRESQMMGTLEIMLLSPTRLSAMIIHSSLWGYVFTSVRFILYLLTGVLLFNLNLGRGNIPGACLILLLSIVCFAGMGIGIASAIMLIKQAGSLDRVLGAVSLLLGGVAYPVDVLPHWLKQLCFFIPFTHSVTGMRQALLQGYSLAQLLPEVLILIVFSAVLFPTGLLAFHLTVQRVKVTGTLGHY